MPFVQKQYLKLEKRSVVINKIVVLIWFFAHLIVPLHSNRN